MTKPYHLEQIKPGIWRLLVPRFIKFSAGWPITTNDQWAIYHVSAFINLLTPLPGWLIDEMGIDDPGFRAHIEDKWLVVDKGDPTETWEKLGRGKNFSSRDGNRLRMKPSSEFDIKRQLLRKGVNFFIPRPVNKEDRRPARGTIELYPNQERDYKTFLQYGAVSVFAPGGGGKTFLGLYACDTIKGPKRIIVDSVLLRQQWQARIDAFIPHAADEIEILTYYYLNTNRRKMRNAKEAALTIYDEIQTIPSNSGLIAAQLPSRYRIGLSATPWREDGNEDLIPAITGLPVGADWEGSPKPDATVWVVNQEPDKLPIAQQLLNQPTAGKTMVFVHRIEYGKKVAAYLGLPFFHGGTSGNRIQQMKKADQFVVSSIATQGTSLNVTRVIELDWLGGRREAGQREYRLGHGEGSGEMHIITTRKEFQTESVRKRLSAIYLLSKNVEIKEIK